MSIPEDSLPPNQPIELVTDSALVDQLMSYIKRRHLPEIYALTPYSIFTLPVDGTEIEELFLKSPETFPNAVKVAVVELLSEYPYSEDADITRKEFNNMKVALSLTRTEKLSKIKTEMVNSPVCFNVVITGIDERKLYITKAFLACPNNHLEASGWYPVNSKREVPTAICSNCKANMILSPEQSQWQYTQRIVLQEPLEESKGGSQLEYDGTIIGDMVGEVSIGEKKQVVAMFRPIFNEKSLQKNEHRIMMDVLSATNLETHKELQPTNDELQSFMAMAKEPDYFDKIASSFAPEIIGEEKILNIKKTLILGCIGGNKTDKKRGSINELLLGDPSVAKSSLLKFGERLIARSMYTSGKGASAAGLTIGLVKRPDGTMVAQAGVLPLCNQGIAFVDELDKMNPQDRSSLHEAMEQQMVSIAKSGNIIRLTAQTSVIAAANPKTGKWNPDLSVTENVNLTIPLLSRFDIRWLILDEVNEALDKRIATGIIREFKTMTEAPIKFDLLTKLINTVRSARPGISLEAEEMLNEIYIRLRKFSQREKQAIIDTRQLEGLLRLATAHAKLCFKDEVDVVDVEIAYNLFAAALESFGFNLNTGHVEQQTFFGGVKENRDVEFWRTFHGLEDDHGAVDPQKLVEELTKGKHHNEYNAQSWVERRHTKGQLRQDASGMLFKV